MSWTPRHTTIALGLGIATTLALLAGLFLNVTRIAGVPAQDAVVVTHRALLRSTAEVYPRAELQGASVQTQEAVKAPSAFLVLDTRQGSVIITQGPRSVYESEFRAKAEVVDRFIQESGSAAFEFDFAPPFVFIYAAVAGILLGTFVAILGWRAPQMPSTEEGQRP